MYTVEYEELRAGLTDAGTEWCWFKVIETFRDGIVDNPLRRAVDRFSALHMNNCCRNVNMIKWSATGGYMEQPRG